MTTTLTVLLVGYLVEAELTTAEDEDLTVVVLTNGLEDDLTSVVEDDLT